MAVRGSRVVVVAVIVAVIATLANCNRLSFGIANASAYFGSYERRAGLTYGTGPRQSLDVYIPTGATRRPIIVFWYGGTWVKGTKDQYRFVGAALANSGYVAVLPDYRLYPQARFPQFIEDGALAMRWTHEHATEIGGDPSAIFLMGHSAGAHLAATLALDEHYLRDVGGSFQWLRGWIGLSGPYDLNSSWTPLLGQVFRAPYSANDWQPILLVGGHSPPALLIHGTQDNMVSAQQADLLTQALSGLDVPVDCRIYDGASHFDTVAAFSLPMRVEAPTLADVRRFIDRTMAGSPPAGPCPDFSK
jgi:acetyl esterase/lipase